MHLLPHISRLKFLTESIQNTLIRYEKFYNHTPSNFDPIIKNQSTSRMKNPTDNNEINNTFM